MKHSPGEYYFSENDVAKMKVDAFLKGIDYGMEIRASEETVTIPKELFDILMKCLEVKSDAPPNQFDNMTGSMNL